MNPPQIDTGKLPGEHFTVKHFSLPLPSNTPFGNMLLKYTKILHRLDYVNQKLRWVFKDWKKWISKDWETIDSEMLDPHQNPLDHLLWTEEICYFLRVTTDELIALSYLIHFYRSNGSYPQNIQIDSIGKLLEIFDAKDNQHYEFRQRFHPSLQWLKTLNKITNAYKHSFINSDINIVGKNEPCVPVLSLRLNNLTKTEEFIFLPLAQIIDAFNAFYSTAIAYIREA